jgi:hypothetical protein
LDLSLWFFFGGFIIFDFFLVQVFSFVF